MEGNMSRRERKKLQSRNKILEAAVSLFHQKGYQATAIADIMNEADLGIGTFYNYFASKEDVLLYLLDKMALDISDKQVKMREQNLSYREMLFSMMMSVTRLIQENRFVLPLCLSVGGDSSRAGNGGHRNPPIFMKMFLQLIIEGQERGEFRNDVSSMVVAEMLHSIFQSAAISRLDMSFEENIEAKLTILLDGICHNVNK